MVRPSTYPLGRSSQTRLLGSVAITAPCLWYIGIYTPDPNAHHGDHGDHGEGEEHEEHEEESKDGGSDAESQGSEDSGSDEGKADDDTPPSSDDEDDSKKNTPEEGDDDKREVKDEASLLALY